MVSPSRVRDDPRPTKEWQLHGYTADLLRLYAKRDVLWFHVPNEGKRPMRTGAFLKRLGLLPGVSDFVIIVKGKAHFLELKTAKGRQSMHQRQFELRADEAGALHMIARSPEEVKNILEKWQALRSADSASLRRVAA